jgi:hypothetical protein
MTSGCEKLPQVRERAGCPISSGKSRHACVIFLKKKAPASRGFGLAFSVRRDQAAFS